MSPTTLLSGTISAVCSFIVSYAFMMPSPEMTQERVSVKIPLQVVTVLRGEAVPYVNKTISDREFDCLARNIYFESGVEEWKGKIAVGQTTMERLKTKRWGKTICSVVYSKSQFSWTLHGNNHKKKVSGKLWEESLSAARDVLRGTRLVDLDGVKYYHADYIDDPHWVDKEAELGKIGRHVFYASAL